MTFQYFFFDTYPGYFLQMTPIALIVLALYVVLKKRAMPTLSLGSVLLRGLFPAYIAALLGLTLFSKIIGDIYYILFYQVLPWSAGESRYKWFTFTYDFGIDFFRNFTVENLGNILIFFPFGILYPLYKPGCSWKRTVATGIIICLLIENIQPFMDRSFDLNDVVLNSIGVCASSLLYFFLSRFLRKNIAD